MRFVTFRASDGKEPRLGALVDGQIRDLHAATHGALGAMQSLLEKGNRGLGLAAQALAAAPRLEAEDVRLLAPLPRPPSLKDFFAFEAHAKAGAERRKEALPQEWYEIPAYFKGNPREIYGPDDEIPWPAYTRKLDFECEVACVVGKEGRDLSPEEAAGHIFGYMIFNDFSARDIQKKERVLGMGPAKGKDFANAFGPWLVTADEVSPETLTGTVRVNGEEWSSGRFKDQHWGFPLLISHLSQEETVYPGDILGSGTFFSGCGMDLDRWVQPGDTIELEVAGLGILRNRIGKPRAQKRLDYRNYGHHH